jgi:hypothetical protein
MKPRAAQANAEQRERGGIGHGKAVDKAARVEDKAELLAALQHRDAPPNEEPIRRISSQEAKDHANLHHGPEDGVIRSRVRPRLHRH